MKKKTLAAAAVFAAILFAGSCNNTKTDSQATSDNQNDTVFEVTDNALLSSNGLPMVVDFSAEWCPPCRKLKPVFAQLQKEYADSVDFVAFDVDSVENLARHYNITSIPTLLFVAPDGTVVHRMVGFHEADEIKKAVWTYLN